MKLFLVAGLSLIPFGFVLIVAATTWLILT